MVLCAVLYPGFVAPWHPGPMALWLYGTLALWNPEPWLYGTLALWHPSPMAPWSRGAGAGCWNVGEGGDKMTVTETAVVAKLLEMQRDLND